MPVICYQEKNFAASSIALIDQANDIIADYQAQGFTLTVRQLYYQFVSKAMIPNTMRSYKRLASIVSDARLAGLIDWDSIEDRTRMLRGLSHWSSPQSILDGVASSYREQKWQHQPYRVEVWIEKDALIGVVEPACNDLDVDYFACRGYASQSELWNAGQRLKRYAISQRVVVLHFGDHDPSGIDMTRDNADRLALFSGGRVTVKRIALNMDQVEQYDPPPNPTKLTDSRAGGYLDAFGDSSWELDALEPKVIDQLIRDEVLALRDADKWAAAEAIETAQRATLKAIAANYPEIKSFLDELNDE